jgi:putative MATE family efflux protein
MKLENNLGKDDIKKLVRRLAFPSMVAQFVNVLYGIVDRMFIGNIEGIGEAALAGAGICAPIVTLISSFASLVGIGGAPILSMRLGEKNRKGASDILANCFMMLVILSLVLTVLVLIFKEKLLMWFGASSVTFTYANEYLTVYVFGSVFAVLAAGLNQFIICQGFSKIGMLTVLIGAALNIILDPVFIFLFDMGVRGAAIATVISQIASCIFAVCFLFSGRVPVKITFEGYSAKIVKRVLSFGMSPFIIIATDSILIIALNAVLHRFGGADGDMYITCVTIVQSYMQLITMPMGGITGGTQAVLSYNYGAKNTDRIKQGERYILKITVIFTIIMFLISRLMPLYFVSLFTKEPEYIKMSIWGIKVFTFGIIPLAFQYTLVDGLTALGVAKVAVSLSLFRKISFLVLTVVLPVFFGARGAFFAEPVVDIVAGMVSTTVFLFIINKLLKRREEMPDGESLYS